jgi:hypothetical protein
MITSLLLSIAAPAAVQTSARGAVWGLAAQAAARTAARGAIWG